MYIFLKTHKYKRRTDSNLPNHRDSSSLEINHDENKSIISIFTQSCAV